MKHDIITTFGEPTVNCDYGKLHHLRFNHNGYGAISIYSDDKVSKEEHMRRLNLITAAPDMLRLLTEAVAEREDTRRVLNQVGAELGQEPAGPSEWTMSAIKIISHVLGDDNAVNAVDIHDIPQALFSLPGNLSPFY